MPRSSRPRAVATLFGAALLACALAPAVEAQPARSSAFAARRSTGPEAGEAPLAEGERGALRRARRHANSEAPGGEAPGIEAPRLPHPHRERASAPRAGRRGGCRLSLQASATRVSAGETVTLDGALSCRTGASALGGSVSVLERERPHGAAGLSDVGAAGIAADGTFQITTPPLVHSGLFLVRLPGAHGARVAVKVAPLVTLSGPSGGSQLARAGGSSHGAAAPGTKLTFSGTVTPAAAGTRVALQRMYATAGEQWHTIAFAHIAADGSFTVSHGFRTPGEVEVRVVARSRGEVPGASEALAYEIVQPQNPHLTIAASADPLSAGQSVTISGTALGAGEQQLTLVARTARGKFAPVAQTVADAGGAYSFTTAPLENTSYRVIDADAASTVLFIGVRDPLTLAIEPGSISSAEASLQAGESLTFSGALSGAPAGRTIDLQRESSSGFGFRTVQSTTADGSGAFTLTHAFATPGTWAMRLRAPADSNTLASTSGEITVHVSSAASPTS